MSVSTETDPVGSQREEEADSDTVERTIAKDDLFHLLQSSRRRFVLAYLRESEGEVTLRELAEQVAAWENEKCTDELVSKERQPVYISLYQRHLDKLEEHGIVEFNKDRGLVARTKGAFQLYPYIDERECN